MSWGICENLLNYILLGIIQYVSKKQSAGETQHLQREWTKDDADRDPSSEAKHPSFVHKTNIEYSE